MCTCGIDMATQHPRPATMSRACRRPGETRGRPASAPPAAARTGPWATGDRRRSANASGSMVSRQKTPTPIMVARQPRVAVKCWRIGGQTVPAR